MQSGIIILVCHIFTDPCGQLEVKNAGDHEGTYDRVDECKCCGSGKAYKLKSTGHYVFFKNTNGNWYIGQELCGETGLYLEEYQIHLWFRC